MDAGPNLVRPSFLALKRSDRDFSFYNRSPKTASHSPVHVIGKVVLFVQVADIHVRVQFIVVDEVSLRISSGHHS